MLNFVSIVDGKCRGNLDRMGPCLKLDSQACRNVRVESGQRPDGGSIQIRGPNRPRIVTDQLPREIQTKDVFHCDIDIGVSA